MSEKPRIVISRYKSLSKHGGKPKLEYNYLGCSECFAQVHHTAKFCPKCGATFSGEPETLKNGKEYQIL